MIGAVGRDDLGVGVRGEQRLPQVLSDTMIGKMLNPGSLVSLMPLRLSSDQTLPLTRAENGPGVGVAVGVSVGVLVGVLVGVGMCR